MEVDGTAGCGSPHDGQRLDITDKVDENTHLYERTDGGPARRGYSWWAAATTTWLDEWYRWTATGSGTRRTA